MLVNGVHPGVGVSAEARAALTADAASRASWPGAAHAPESGRALLVGIVPDNPAAAASGDMLAVMFFALMIGVGLLTRTDAARRFEETVEGLYDATMRLIGVVIGLAPLGVAALLFTLTAQIGWSVLLLLARYTLLVVGALALHQFVVYACSRCACSAAWPRTLLPWHPGGDADGVLDQPRAARRCRPR
ncbi:MAG: cation:dicarboxylase symporter family transporter [Steroidobacteraceae bacterium]